MNRIITGVFIASIIIAAAPEAHAAKKAIHAGAVTPSAGSSKADQPITFTATYRDAGGYRDIKSVYFLMNKSLSVSRSLYVHYSRLNNKLYLMNDAGRAWKGGYAPGSSKVIENSYAKLDCSKTAVSGSGDTLAVRWAVTPKASFTGEKNTYLSATDKRLAATGWVWRGKWTVKDAITPMAMRVITSQAYPGGIISPSGGVGVSDGASQTFTITARTGFSISDILVDGVSKGPLTSYEFSNVTSNHTITAKFLPLPPSNLQAQVVSSRDIKLTWTDNAANQAGWMVQKSADGIYFTDVALITPFGMNVSLSSSGDIPKDEPSVVVIRNLTPGAGLTIGSQSAYTLKNLTAGNTYYFRVGAVKVCDGPVSYANSEIIQMTLPSLVPGSPSIVTVSGRRIIIQKRNSDGTLEIPETYTVKGVNWSPASKDTRGADADQPGMRAEFGKWCDIDIPLIGDMNANTLRTYLDFGLTGDYPVKDWKYILDECYANGVMVIINVDRCIADRTRIQQIVSAYKDHPAILMWLIGNEWNRNNLYRTCSDINSAAAAVESAAALIKTLDQNHPVASSLGEWYDLTQFKDIIQNRCPSVDVWCLNIYRGRNFRTLFDKWRECTTKPMVIGEFGCDAYDGIAGREDEATQRTYEYYQWQDIAGNLAANDPENACSGGCVFEFNDEWWKAGNVGIQDAGGFVNENDPDGYFNEEWWGLVDIDRNPRDGYYLFRDFFGGASPTPPPAYTAEEYNVVRFSTQPDMITTNLQDYPVMDVCKGAVQVMVNGTAVAPDKYYGIRKDVVLSAGSNTITLSVTYRTGAVNYQKTVIYNPAYSTAARNMLYVNGYHSPYPTIVIDLDAGAVLGKLPVSPTAVTHDGRYYTDKDANLYSTAYNNLVKRLNFTTGITSHYPLFSNDDAVVYSQYEALNVANNTLITNTLPRPFANTDTFTSNDNYIFKLAKSLQPFMVDMYKIDPVTFSIVKHIQLTPSKTNYGGVGITRDGRYSIVTSYGYGVIDMIDTATEQGTSITGLSDYARDIAISYDDLKIFVGSDGNSYWGGGGVYVVDKNTKQLNDYYKQYGSSYLGISPEYLFSSSQYVDHFGDGTVAYGSVFHRGMEVFRLNSESKLEYQKSFFLVYPNSRLGRILYKPAADQN